MASFTSDTQRGVALVIVLWVMALLGLVAGTFALSMRTETALVRNSLESAQAKAAAEAGVQLALLGALKEKEEERWRMDGTVYETVFSNTRLRMALVDAGGKIDLNRAPQELLLGLLGTAGVSGEDSLRLIDAILDWQDSDQVRRLHGAETVDYQSAGLPYGTKDGPFDNVEELLLVRGMTPELFRRIEGALTVYSNTSGVNPTLATRQVLLSLPGASPENVDAYLELREQHAREGSPPPAFTFTPAKYLSGAQREAISIHVESRTRSGTLAYIVATIKPVAGGESGDAFRVLNWKDGTNLMFHQSQESMVQVGG